MENNVNLKMLNLLHEKNRINTNPYRILSTAGKWTILIIKCLFGEKNVCLQLQTIKLKVVSIYPFLSFSYRKDTGSDIYSNFLQFASHFLFRYDSEYRYTFFEKTEMSSLFFFFLNHLMPTIFRSLGKTNLQ